MVFLANSIHWLPDVVTSDNYASLHLTKSHFHTRTEETHCEITKLTKQQYNNRTPSIPKENNKNLIFLMTLCSYTRMRRKSHLTSFVSCIHKHDEKDTTCSPRSCAILEPKTKTKNPAFTTEKSGQNNGKFSLLTSLPPTQRFMHQIHPASQSSMLFCSLSASSIHISPFWTQVISLSSELSVSFSAFSSICCNFSYTSRYMTGILTIFVLFTTPSILSVAFVFKIGSLCTTSSGEKEAREEEDQVRVGAAGRGGQARGGMSGVIDNKDGAAEVFNTTALVGRIGEAVEDSCSSSTSVILLFTHVGSSPSLTTSLLVIQGDFRDWGLAILAFIWAWKRLLPLLKYFLPGKQLTLSKASLKPTWAGVC